ncbi:MAG: LamG-like jellyroll fold domain-containing protein, partial [Candidatus Hatepunaea meridiana]|nr:LamG-like jellyroll fold domain-containing protein [Candidatus Hatepunaea meridiana]
MKTFIYLSLAGLLFLLLPQLTYAGYALEFDGNNDYVSLDHDAVNGLSDCTVEYWVYIVREDAAASIISGAINDAGNNEYLHFYDFNTGLRPHIKGQSAENGVRFPLGEWFHAALTRNGNGQWIAYFNGEEAGRGNLPRGALVIANNGLVLGQDQDAVGGGFDPNQAFRGKLDELRIWNFIRSEEEINTTLNCMVNDDEEGLVAYYRFDEAEGQVLNDLTENEFNGRLGSNDGEDNADPRWIESDAPVYGGVAEFSADFIAFGPIAQGESSVEFKIANTSEDDDEWHSIEFTLTDLGEDPDWLEIDPDEGVIEVGNEIAVTFTTSAGELDPGEYERTVRFEANAANIQRMDIPVSMIVVEGAARLFGTVTDEATGDPIEGALIRTVADFDFRQVTDEDGHYEFEDMPVFTYHLQVTADDYLPMNAEEVEVGADEEIELNFALLHGNFIPDPLRIVRSLAPDEEIEVNLNITNDGNGPLTWSVEQIFPEGAQAEPWELREDVNVQEIVEDNQINGVAFAEGHFYISGGNNREDINKIYVLDSEFEPVRQFDQFHESDYGMRDLCWDGELIWGADENVIYGFTTGGQLVTTIECESRDYRNLTWDPDNNLFWSSNVTSDILAENLDGEVVREIERPDCRIYGLAYWSDDPDGYNLYIFSRGEETDIQVSKLNLDNGDVAVLNEIDFEGERRPGGISITNRWDPYSWVLTGIVQNDDHLAIWHLESRTDWMIVEPVAGVIQADESEDLTVTLNSEGFPGQTDLSANLLFTHDGVDGSYDLPVLLSVTGVGGMAQRMLNMNIGWNMVSVNVQPDDIDFRDLVQPLVDENLLILMKTGDGRFYYPPGGYCDIEFWEGAEGYQVLVARDAGLLIEGEVIPWDSEIELENGWNLISYLPRVSVDAVNALSNIEDVLIIAKNGLGHFYLPEWEFSNIGLMREGLGYQLRVDGDVELVYTVD